MLSAFDDMLGLFTSQITALPLHSEIKPVRMSIQELSRMETLETPVEIIFTWKIYMQN